MTGRPAFAMPVASDAADLAMIEQVFRFISSNGQAEDAASAPELLAVLRGAPASKARHRFNRKGGAYSTQEMQAAELRTAYSLKKQFAGRRPLTGNLALTCVFYRPNSQRIDTDNLLKHICDAATGILWIDDSQITALYGRAELDPKMPRTVLALGAHVSTLKRGTDSAHPCAVCGKPIRTSLKDGHRRVTCSTACSNVHRGYESLSIEVPCAHCGNGFRRKTRTQKYCGHPCQRAALAGRNQAKGNPKSKCIACGKQLAHWREGRCRACWKLFAAANSAAGRSDTPDDLAAERARLEI
jgi:Holliday junction resolvase RusA-like endonuclease/endogenous inhibitor of DNA gyrase (YacG/DUF329 family)